MASRNLGKICFLSNDATDMLIDLWSEETIHVRAVQGMTLFGSSIVTDVFAFSKQQAIQLPSVLENLPFSF